MGQTAIVFTSLRTRQGSVVGAASQQGIPIIGGNVGNTWFVDTVDGSDTRGRGTPFSPYATMGKVFPYLNPNDTIYFGGKVREQLVAPLLGADGAALTGVKIVGTAQGGVRDDDGAKWTYPASGAVAGQALLACRQQGWGVANFLMTPEPTSGACVKLNRAEDAVNPDASHFIAQGMRFVGIDVTTTYGIQDVGGCSAIQIYGCEFYLLTTGLYSSSQSIAVPLRWQVKGNRFLQNTNDIIVPSSYCVYEGNRHFNAAATEKVEISGGGYNVVTGNVFPDVAADIDPAHGYDGEATDTWTSNSAADAVVFGNPA
jgi:hypothetical protein